MERLRYVINIVIVVLMIGAVAIKKDGSIGGKPLYQIEQSDAEEAISHIDSVGVNGEIIINTTSLGRDVYGFAGRTPIQMTIVEGRISEILFLKNDETPEFMERLLRAGLADRWTGMTPSEAVSAKVDAVSGATYSSKAIISNVQLAAQTISATPMVNVSLLSELGINAIAGVLVVALGVVMTFLKSRHKWLRIVQLVLNVAVLGFWCGSFLSLAAITSWMANGVNLSLSLVVILMLAVTIIIPLFGKKGTYCYHHCPMGAAQELVGLIPAKKLKLGQKTAKVLNNLRYYILALLLFVMWLGVGFNIMEYEIFSIFMLSSASTVVMVMAAIFLLLSIFIPRPYCRFVCPTGALITISQKTK